MIEHSGVEKKLRHEEEARESLEDQELADPDSSLWQSAQGDAGYLDPDASLLDEDMLDFPVNQKE